MLSKLATNTIIKGPIEYFCIVCECRLDILEKVHAHLEDGTHEKKLASYPFLEKYAGNRIRKIKSIYFCELCSAVLNTAGKVNVHVTTKEHRDIKGALQLRPGPNNGVLAFNDVLIKENAWHSVKDESCSICGVEFDEGVKHKKEPSHLLRLVQVKVEFFENGLYRKIDEFIFQCLTCDREYDINTLNDHFESDTHYETFMNSKIENNEDPSNNSNVTTTGNNEVVPLETVSTGAVPKNPTDDKEEQKRFAKENRITYNVDNTNAYCRICEIRMPATLNSMKEHVNGTKHVSKLKAKKPRLCKQSMRVFIDHMTTVQNVFNQDVVINRRICIPFESFTMLSKNSERLRCHACEMNVNDDYSHEHILIPKHARMMGESPVVTTFDGEFLREIRPGNFHCGYCNIVIPKWEEVEAHVEGADHKYKRGACEYRLKQYMPGIMEHEGRQRLGMFLRMLHEFM